MWLTTVPLDRLATTPAAATGPRAPPGAAVRQAGPAGVPRDGAGPANELAGRTTVVPAGRRARVVTASVQTDAPEVRPARVAPLVRGELVRSGPAGRVRSESVPVVVLGAPGVRGRTAGDRPAIAGLERRATTGARRARAPRRVEPTVIDAGRARTLLLRTHSLAANARGTVWPTARVGVRRRRPDRRAPGRSATARRGRRDDRSAGECRAAGTPPRERGRRGPVPIAVVERRGSAADRACCRRRPAWDSPGRGW